MRTQEHQYRPSRRIPAISPPVKASVAFVSTYPPAICGLATFTASLREAFIRVRGSDSGLGVLALEDDGPRGPRRDDFIGALDPADPWSIRLAVEQIADYDVVILQHEYGIWGPDMGISVLDFVHRVANPLITTLHTLLPSPTGIQRQIVEGLARRSDYTVVPTISARELLIREYAVDPMRVAVIPHGTRQSPPEALRFSSSDGRGPRLLTWGLIGPGKGIETALRAVAGLVGRYPDLVYTVAGRTHPKVLARDGESYRGQLESVVFDLGIGDNVEFLDDYLTSEQIDELLSVTDVVVLPYDSTEQIVSGVLAEAVAADVAVVATAFPHARELADTGAVSAVAHRDPEAMADAIADLIGSPGLRREMSRAQRSVSADLDWHAVSRRYQELIERAVGRTTMSHAHTAS